MTSTINLSVPAAMPGRSSTGKYTMPKQKYDSDSFRAKLRRAKITQQAFGQWLDRDPRTITRWASGRENIPAYVWMALNTLLMYAPKRRKRLIKDLNKTLALEQQQQKEREKLSA